MRKANTNYCIEYKGLYNEYYTYVDFPDVKALAVYLNKRVADCKDMVSSVIISHNYSTEGARILLAEEYENQLFYETYEARLIAEHRRWYLN